MHGPKRSAGTDPLSVSRILHMTGASPDRVSLLKLKENILRTSATSASRSYDMTFSPTVQVRSISPSFKLPTPFFSLFFFPRLSWMKRANLFALHQMTRSDTSNSKISIEI